MTSLISAERRGTFSMEGVRTSLAEIQSVSVDGHEFAAPERRFQFDFIRGEAQDGKAVPVVPTAARVGAGERSIWAALESSLGVASLKKRLLTTIIAISRDESDGARLGCYGTGLAQTVAVKIRGVIKFPSKIPSLVIVGLIL